MAHHGVDVGVAWSLPVAANHAVGPCVGAGAVVGQKHHQGVVRYAHCIEKPMRRPIWASVWVTNPAYTSIMRA